MSALPTRQRRHRLEQGMPSLDLFLRVSTVYCFARRDVVELTTDQAS